MALAKDRIVAAIASYGAAAGAVGDDRLGVDSPESFTHGTSEQRVHWLRTGYETGDVQACDAFSLSESEL